MSTFSRSSIGRSPVRARTPLGKKRTPRKSRENSNGNRSDAKADAVSEVHMELARTKEENAMLRDRHRALSAEFDAYWNQSTSSMAALRQELEEARRGRAAEGDGRGEGPTAAGGKSPADCAKCRLFHEGIERFEREYEQVVKDADARVRSSLQAESALGEQLRQSQAALEQARAEQQAARARAAASEAALREELAEAQAEAARRKEELVAKQEELIVARRRAVDDHKRLTAAEQDLSLREAAIEGLSERLSGAAEEAAELRDAVAARDDRLSALREQLEGLLPRAGGEAPSRRLEEELSRARAGAEEARAALSEREREASALEAEAAALKEENLSLRGAARSAEQRAQGADGLRRRVAALEEENGAQARKVEELTTALRNLRSGFERRIGGAKEAPRGDRVEQWSRKLIDLAQALCDVTVEMEGAEPPEPPEPPGPQEPLAPPEPPEEREGAAAAEEAEAPGAESFHRKMSLEESLFGPLDGSGAEMAEVAEDAAFPSPEAHGAADARVSPRPPYGSPIGERERTNSF